MTDLCPQGWEGNSQITMADQNGALLMRCGEAAINSSKTYCKRSELGAEGCAEKWHRCRNGCRNELQKWVAETVQNLAQIGCAEKNGTDADAFAEGMQKEERNCTYLVQIRC